ncbi:serine/threonine-protein kinase [Aquimonas voraii]|uniref:Serine/threonine protein kinase n=1 Tax=Aquimonas voraii TaxID=265719 RepID=A0A1G6U9U1_9GAMM|nr:serine/threonine-protein kinase [Aquimonas voraii]SDD38138.1 serine/threonine protein kinase [Aquimonas voraii]
MAGDSWRLAELFDALADLPVDEQRARLAELPPEQRAELERLLALDAGDTRSPQDPLGRVVADVLEVAAREVREGARIGPWRVLRELGAGGMGTVLLAERADGDFEQKVAIKLIRGFPTEDERRRLRHERRILAQLDHPNIARLLDGGETEDGQPYVVMEYVDGRTLLDWLAEHPLDLRQRLALFDRIADAVQHAHERLVIHRDLKPNNVMVRADGDPRLLDFGVAKLVDVSQGADSRQTSTRVWTPGYASPEQRAGGLITTATDVYGLSILLREMLTGERQPGQAVALPPGFIGLKLDAELRGILQAGSAEDPGLRYPTVEALRADLQRWLDGRTVRVTPDSALYRLRKFARRHRAGVAVAAGLLVAALLFVWRLDVERDRALVAEAIALADRERAENAAADARAALGFLSRTLVALTPERIQKREISVRELADTARGDLEGVLADRPRVQDEVRRVLGHLYVALGEPGIAVDLLARGIPEADPAHPDEALALAKDLDAWSSMLGLLGEPEAGLEKAERAWALRQRHAPHDPVQRLHSADQLAYAHYRLGDFERAEALWREVLAASALPDAPFDVLTNAHQALAGMLNNLSRPQEALQVLDAGEALMQGRVAAEAPERVTYLRGRLEALVQLGRAGEAEALARKAIEIQTRAVGERNSRMAFLLNALGLALNEQARFREAQEAFEQSLAASDPLAEVPAERAPLLLNLASVAESAGDYPRALQLFDEGIAVLERSEPSVDSLRLRQAKRSRARTLGLLGRGEEALETLQSLESEALRLDGPDAFEPAMLAWQRAVLARHLGQPERGFDALAVAETRMRALLPEDHAIYAYMARVRGHLLALQGDLAGAARALDAGLVLLESSGGAAFDVASLQIERARVHQLRGEVAQARALLRQALPVLRQAVRPTEVTRALAERWARELGLS